MAPHLKTIGHLPHVPHTAPLWTSQALLVGLRPIATHTQIPAVSALAGRGPGLPLALPFQERTKPISSFWEVGRGSPERIQVSCFSLPSRRARS